jgi:hypothetical protein
VVGEARPAFALDRADRVHPDILAGGE